MKLRVKHKDLLMKSLFVLCLIYVLMRPFVTNYVTYYYKQIFMFFVGVGLALSILNKRNLRKIGIYVIGHSLLFYIYIVLNALLNGGTELLRYGFERYIFYTFPLFLMTYIQNKINWDKVLSGIMLFGILDASISIIEFVTKRQMFPMSDGELSVQLTTRAGALISRTYGLQGNYFLLAEILCVCGISAFYLFRFRQSKLAFIGFIIISIGILSTGTRGYYVAYAIGILFLYILESVSKKKQITPLIRIVVLVVIIYIALRMIIFSGFQFGNSFVDSLIMRIRMVFDWRGDSANSARLSRWEWALSMWKKAPLFGHGACFTDTRYSGFIAVTESGVLKRLVELGLFGTILQYGTMLPLILKGIKRFRIEQDQRSAFFFSVLVAFFIEDLILQRYTALEYTIITWSSLVYLAYYQKPLTNNHSN